MANMAAVLRPYFVQNSNLPAKWAIILGCTYLYNFVLIYMPLVKANVTTEHEFSIQ